MERKNIIFIIFLTIFATLTFVFGGYIVYDKIIQKDKTDITPKEIVDSLTEEDSEEISDLRLLAIIEGEYLSKSDTGSIYGVYIKDDDILFYMMDSDGGKTGKIENIKKIDKNVYSLTVHYEEIDNGDFGYSPEETIENKVDITKINDDILIVNSTEYKRFSGEFADWDAKGNFFNN